MLAVGVNPGDTIHPISTPEVYVDESTSCVDIILGCLYCRPNTQYTVEVCAVISVQTLFLVVLESVQAP